MDLQEYRKRIDEVDENLTRLFTERMAICAEIAAYKRENGLPVSDAVREREKLQEITAAVPDDLRGYAESLYTHLFALSRDYQKTLGQKTGLLGAKLSHSYSPQIHALLGDAAYTLFAIGEDELPAFLQSDRWDALNVTVPYKKTAVAHCDILSDIAKRLGNVNVMRRCKDGTVYGDNTDYFGFSHLVQKSGIAVSGKKVLVLGSGGASATVCAVLHDMGAGEITVISRTGGDNYQNLSRHRDAEWIVNATPVGMYPHNGEQMLDLKEFPACCAVFDLVYNPLRTKLLLQAETLGMPCFDGLSMLVAQAKRSREIFTGKEIASEKIGEIEKILRRRMQNIILIGMPGCGKSTVAALLAKRLGRTLIDSDDEIVSRIRMPVSQYFAQYGEAAFRKVESEVLADLAKQSGAVIATGGGCVTREENYALLHQNGTIVWLKRGLSALPTDGRPISQATSAEELYRKREAQYARFADFSVENNAAAEDAARAIEEKF